MPQILMVWIHFFLKKECYCYRSDAPGQNYFETCFLFLGLFSPFFLTLITRKLHFVVICHLKTVSFFHFRSFKQKDWWKTFCCKLVGK